MRPALAPQTRSRRGRNEVRSKPTEFPIGYMHRLQVSDRFLPDHFGADGCFKIRDYSHEISACHAVMAVFEISTLRTGYTCF